MRNIDDDVNILLSLIKGCLIGMQGNIDVCKSISEIDGKTPDFYDGFINGLSQAKGAIEACLRLYDTYLDGKMPEEMIEKQLRNMD